MIRLGLLMFAFCCAAAPASAQACSVSATPMSFAPYNAFSGSAVNAASTVTVHCTGLLLIGVVYDVRLGTGQSGSIPVRKMKHSVGASELDYQVYTNPARTNVWGNGTQGGTYSGIMLLGVLSRTHTHTAYSRIPASQQVEAGNYSDSPVMTIVY